MSWFKPEGKLRWLHRRGYRLYDLTTYCNAGSHKRCRGYRRPSPGALDFCVCPCHGQIGGGAPNKGKGG